MKHPVLMFPVNLKNINGKPDYDLGKRTDRSLCQVYLTVILIDAALVTLVKTSSQQLEAAGMLFGIS